MHLLLVFHATYSLLSGVATGLGFVSSSGKDLLVEASNDTGSARLGITEHSDNVQISNYNPNSFIITNTGDKTIASVQIDVTNALYPDSVFDPFGQAGDTISKPLTINTKGGTGVITPSIASYIGVGGTVGFEGILLEFDNAVEGGFGPSETLGFSVDMDPNSIAGTTKDTLDSGADPSWRHWWYLGCRADRLTLHCYLHRWHHSNWSTWRSRQPGRLEGPCGPGITESRCCAHRQQLG